VRRGVGLVVAGAAASGLLAIRLPVPLDPGLRGCVALLPLVLAGLAVVRRRIGAGPTPLAGQLALGAWVFLTVGFDLLGLPAARRSLAVGLALALAAWSAPIWRAARRRIGCLRRGDRALLVALPFLCGVALLPWIHAAATPSGDEPYYLLLVESLASDGNLDLTDEYATDVAARWGVPGLGPQRGDPIGPNGEAYSRHESLLVPLLLPFWWVGGLFGARLAMLLLWSLLGERVARLAGALGVDGRGAFRAWLATLLAPPLALYAYRLWAELPAALAVAVALDLWLRGRAEERGLHGLRALGFALALVALALLKWRFLLVAAPLAVLPMTDRARHRSGRSLPRWLPAAAIVIVGVALLLANRAATGRLLRVYDAADVLDLVAAPGKLLLGLSGLAFDHAFGLVGAAPLWLLGLGGLAALVVRHGALRRIVIATLPYVVLVASLREWFGGWSPPFRYGVVLMPLVAVGLAAWFDRRPTRGARVLAHALGLATLLLSVVWLAEPGWATSFADGRSRWVDLFATPFGVDLARFLPSAVRPRAATYVVPLVLLGLLVAAALGRRGGAPRWRSAGAVALALTLAAWLTAARRLPTRIAEVEDPWVAKRGGALHPERWMPDRTRYRAGWSLRPGDLVRIRPNSGGDALDVRIEVRGYGDGPPPPRLEASSGSRVLGSFEVAQDGRWTDRLVAIPSWTPGDELDLRLVPARGAPTWGGVILDRVEFDWR